MSSRPSWLAAARPALFITDVTKSSLRLPLFGDDLKRYRFAGAGRAGDETVPVNHLGQEPEFKFAFGDE